MYFEWDEAKNEINQKKHGVSFETAAFIFDDPGLLCLLDRRFSYEKERWMSIGAVGNALILFVAYIVEKGEQHEEIFRILSARKAQKSEQRRYLQSDP